MQASGHLRFFVGTYTDEPSQSKGIAQVSLNRQTGEMTRLDDIYILQNPSFIAHTYLGVYSFSEIAEQDGAQLVCIQGQRVHTLSIAGDYPCHLAISPDNKHLAVANYGSGNVSIYSLDSQGKPVALEDNLFEQGYGPNQDRQLSPHAHQVVFQQTESTLATVDLGSDAVRFYQREDDKFQLIQSVAMPPGSGPRHLAFNRKEDKAYVVCELSETLVVLTKTGQGWQVVQQLDLLPSGEKGQAAAAIKLSDDERFIYVSCRHQNQVSCFEVSGDVIEWRFMTDSGGQFPRDFTLTRCGEWLLVANQHTNNITSYHRNVDDGSITATGFECHVDAPVCLIEQHQ